MKITGLETIRLREHPNLIWVRVLTNDGLVGIGETFLGAAAVEAYLHEEAAPLLLGQNPLSIDRIAEQLRGYLGFRGAGVEMRGNSAVNIALWDILGKVTGQPVWQLLGGRTRDSIRVYNTCAGSNYVRENRPVAMNWGVSEKPSKERYEDLQAFLTAADELAQSLLEEGITGMKIWPFDACAVASSGYHISADELNETLDPFRKIRSAVGERMDIMVEFHSLWRLPAAIRIADALRPFNTFWHEDPLRMDNWTALKTYAARSAAPVCASETLAGRWAFRELFETGAVGVAMFDVGWCGGLTEAKAIADMAAASHLPIAPHDCTGPILLTASTHLSVAAPNALVQEIVRAFYHGWYRDIVTTLPPLNRGFISPPDGPGLGVDLLPDIDRRSGAIVRRTVEK
jgi:galactonate dehydratase